MRPYGIDFEVPAGTPPSAPATAVVGVPGGAITRVVLSIPTGHNGLTGFQLLLAGTPIIPYGGSGWVIGSGEEFTWEINQPLADGQLSVAGYNQGIYPHTFHLLAEWVTSIGPAPVSASLAVPGTDLTQTDQGVAALTGYGPVSVSSADEQLAGLDTSALQETGSAPSSLTASPSAASAITTPYQPSPLGSTTSASPSLTVPPVAAPAAPKVGPSPAPARPPQKREPRRPEPRAKPKRVRR